MAFASTGSTRRGRTACDNAGDWGVTASPPFPGTASRIRRQAWKDSICLPVGVISQPRSGLTPHIESPSSPFRRWMLTRLGRRYSEVVSFTRALPSDSGMIDCTVPLPKERLPTTIARP